MDGPRGAPVPLRHERMRGDGVELHVVRAGEGPPVLLLHGFPDHWITWTPQIEALARAGFSVLAPDLRGYNLSDRPAGRAAYHLRHLVADVAALVRATGRPGAHLVGHDWGGIIGWAFAGEHPGLLDRMVIMNAPHMQRFLEHARWPSQLLRSWYAGFFQLPWLPERALSAAGFAAVRRMYRDVPARPEAFAAEEVDATVAALARPGALTAAVNYYRENLAGGGLELARRARTDAEVLVVWGERDAALVVEQTEGLERFAPRVRVHRVPQAGHWVHREAADEVNRVMIDFLRA